MGFLKNIGNALVSSAGSIATGLLGGIGSVLSQNSANKANAKAVDKTNAANLQIAQETNASNRQIASDNNASNLALAQQQNAWNLAQWNRENQYNSPQAQLARNEAAGINGLSSIDNTASSPVASADLANQVTGAPMQGATMQAATVSPVDYSQIMQGVLAARQAENVQANTENLQKENGWIDKKNGAIVGAYDVEIEAGKLANYYAHQTMGSRVSAAQFSAKEQKWKAKLTREMFKEAQQKAQQAAIETSNYAEKCAEELKLLKSQRVRSENLEQWEPLVAESQAVANFQDSNLTEQQIETEKQNRPLDIKMKKTALVGTLMEQLSGGSERVMNYIANPNTLKVILECTERIKNGDRLSKAQTMVWNNYRNLLQEERDYLTFDSEMHRTWMGYYKQQGSEAGIRLVDDLASIIAAYYIGKGFGKGMKSSRKNGRRVTTTTKDKYGSRTVTEYGEYGVSQ